MLKVWDEEQASIWDEMKLLCTEIFSTLFEINNFRDTWNGPHMILLAVPRGMEITYWSEKIDSIHKFGTDQKGFFLETNLLHVDNIRKMNDDFWLLICELSQLGKLDLFQGTVVPPREIREHPFLHKKSKNILYSLIRGSLALESYYGTNEDFGFIIVRWTYDSSWDELLDKGWRVLRNLYRINYELWKKRVK